MQRYKEYLNLQIKSVFFCNIKFLFCIKIHNRILTGKKDLKKKVT